MNLEVTVDQILAGDRDAFRRFYTETEPPLSAYVRKRVGIEKDVEEIVQDSYLSFLDSLPLFRGKSSLWTFLVSIARHEIADYWRKKYAKRAIRTVPFMNQVYVEKLYSSKQTAVVISEVYAQLTKEQTKLLRWKYEDGLSVKQIAKQLEISLKAAESRLFRARRAFVLAYEGLRE